jgi:hypothetical protein
MKSFLTIFAAVLLAILAAASILYFVNHRKPSPVKAEVSEQELKARAVMKELTVENMESVCGKPKKDYVGHYESGYDWRILTYEHVEVNFLLKDGRWNYDFTSDGNGHILPDSSMVNPQGGIKLACDKE